VLQKYSIAVPPAVLEHLLRFDSETPKPGDARLQNSSLEIIASAETSLRAAAAVAEAAGCRALILGDDLEGEARTVAAEHAELVLQSRQTMHDPRPVVLISGGETTVTVRGKGRGGRNAEYLLALNCALAERGAGVHAIAIDTDGIDGSEDNAGCICAPDSVQRARQAGYDAQAFLDNNDAYSFFEALDDLVITGPTLTNVNDFRAILVL